MQKIEMYKCNTIPKICANDMGAKGKYVEKSSRNVMA